MTTSELADSVAGLRSGGTMSCTVARLTDHVKDDTFTNTRFGMGISGNGVCTGGNALQESKAVNIVVSEEGGSVNARKKDESAMINEHTTSNTAANSVIDANYATALIQLKADLESRFTTQLSAVRDEFNAAMQAREAQHRVDLYKLRLIFLRTLQLPDEIMREVVEGVGEGEYDEEGMLF